MNHIRTLRFVALLTVILAACGAPTTTALTPAPSTTNTAPDATSAPVATSAPGATTNIATSVPAATTAASMDMGSTSGSGESYGPSIAADLPAAAIDTATFPLTVENCGRKLTFAKPPERIVGLWQPSNELLLALGVQNHIVAFAGNYTAMPKDLEALNKHIPQIGSSMAWPSKEVLLSQKPDLVISEGIEGFAFDVSKGYASLQEIAAAGGQVFSTGSSCTPLQGKNRTMSAVYDDLRNLGKIFGVSARADALIKKLKERQNNITSRVAGKPPVKVAFYNGGEGPVHVLSFGVWADAMKEAGGDDVLGPALAQGGYQVSAEAFAAAQPEVILVGYFPGADPNERITFLKSTFPTVPAVQHNRLVLIPTIETEATIQIMDGFEKIARALHPDVFK